MTRYRKRHQPSFYPMGADPNMVQYLPMPNGPDEARDYADFYEELYDRWERKKKDKDHDNKKDDKKNEKKAPTFSFLEVLGILFPLYFLIGALSKVPLFH